MTSTQRRGKPASQSGQVSRGRPTAAQAERKREQILEAATAAFATDGMNVNIEAIARAAGISKATLYARYPDRMVLFEAVLERLHQLRPAMDAYLNDTLAIRPMLLEYAQVLLEEFMRPEFQAFYRMTIQRTPQERQAHGLMVVDFDTAYVAPLREALQRRIGKGELAPQLDAGLAARLLVRQVTGEIDYHISLGDDSWQSQGKRILSPVINLLVGGWLVEEPAREEKPSRKGSRGGRRPPRDTSLSASGSRR